MGTANDVESDDGVNTQKDIGAAKPLITQMLSKCVP